MSRSRGVLLALVVCTMVLIACDQPQSAAQVIATQPPEMDVRYRPTPTGKPQAAGSINSSHGVSASSAPRYYGPWSLEERIIRSDAIARVRLNSILAGAEYSREHEGARFYRPVVELNYEVIEYLKGSGRDKIAAEYDFFHRFAYQSEASVTEDARRAAEAWIGSEDELFRGNLSCGKPPFGKLRTVGSCTDAPDLSDVPWRDEESLIFLTQFTPYSNEDTGTGAEERSRFTVIGGGHYSIQASAAWMPSVMPDGERGTSAERSFVIVEYPQGTTQPIFSLPDIRKRIEEIDALIKGGENIPNYRDCLQNMYRKRRTLTWDIAQNGQTYLPGDFKNLKDQLEMQIVSKQCPQ